jgi:hypothetical protein
MSCTDYTDYVSTINCVINNHDLSSQIFDKERALFNKINEFNEAYSCYTRKKYNDQPNVTQLGIGDCDSTISTELYRVSMMSLYSEIETLIVELDSIKPTDNNIQSMAVITEISNANTALRNDLKVKMKEIQGSPGSHYDQSKRNLDSTIYASILWTTLATGFLYYVFVEL